jgi:hypothetical protein
LLTGANVIASGVSGGGHGAYVVNRTTRAALREAADRAERVAADGGRAARETLMRSSALELLRAAARMSVEMGALGVRVTRDERRRGLAYLDALRDLEQGPAYLTPRVLQDRWATMVELVHTFAHAWPVLDPAEYGGDPVETQLAAGGWMPEVYERARGEVEEYARFVVATALAVVQDTPPPADRPRPALGPADPADPPSDSARMHTHQAASRSASSST